MAKKISWLILLITIWCASCAAGNGMVTKKTEEPYVYITNSAVSPPLGFFGLVQHDNSYCAVKFMETGRDEKKQYRYALYDWHYQGDGSGDFSRSTAKHGTGKATYHYAEISSRGRLAFQTGNMDIVCAEMHILWIGDTTLTFQNAKKDEKEQEIIKAGVKIAPTKWTNISEINVFDKRLKWYHYDAKRQTIKIHVNQLW